MKTLCAVKLFLNPRLYRWPEYGTIDIEIYLDLDKSVDEQVFNTYDGMITGFEWKKVSPFT